MPKRVEVYETELTKQEIHAALKELKGIVRTNWNPYNDSFIVTKRMHFWEDPNAFSYRTKRLPLFVRIHGKMTRREGKTRIKMTSRLTESVIGMIGFALFLFLLIRIPGWWYGTPFSEGPLTGFIIVMAVYFLVLFLVGFSQQGEDFRSETVDILVRNLKLQYVKGANGAHQND